jgi:hypothetical protein
MTYIRKRGKVSGPHDEEMLRSMVQRGQITLLDEASDDGEAWEPADSFPWFQLESRVVDPTEVVEEIDSLSLDEHLVDEPAEDGLALEVESSGGQQDAAALPSAPLQLEDPVPPEEAAASEPAGISFPSVAAENGIVSTGAASLIDDLQLAEEPGQRSPSPDSFQPSSPAPRIAEEEYELSNTAELDMEEGPVRRKGNMGLIVLGYIAGFLSLFVLPFMLGFVGVVCGMINFSQEEHTHGVAQIAIAMICTILGLVVFA